MTPKERTAMQQVLLYLEAWQNGEEIKLYEIEDTITALREALAEQEEQEPNYFGLTHDHTWLSIDKKQYDKLKPEGRMACYAAPVRTKDLTDDEIEVIFKSHIGKQYDDFARAVIAADREKNK